MTASLGNMISIVAQAFENDKDKGGKPYVLHCLHVMNAVRHLGEKAMIIAVAHDLLEDKPEFTAERLIALGFDTVTVDCIVHMTHVSGETYGAYLMRVGGNPITRKIKREDLKHNMEAGRMKGLREKDFIRLQKYQYAYAYLKLLDKIDELAETEKSYYINLAEINEKRAKMRDLLVLVDDAETKQKAI